jgi:putative photosynthetic complex assembly protein
MNKVDAFINPSNQPVQPAVPVIVRWILLGLGLLLLGVYAIRLSGQDIRQPDAPLVWKKNLHFADGARGEILVIDAATNQQVAVFEGEQGFLRGTLRALVRERKKRSMGAEEAFELSGHADGQMVLRDPATGEAIHLASFGPTNAQIYRQLQ